MGKILIAICGESCSGKDTLAKLLECEYKSRYRVHRIVSHTTRPKRLKEVDGIDYNFVNNEEFDRLETNGSMLECAEFRKWKYGTSKTEVREGCINIGVFDLSGMYAIRRIPGTYVIPICIKTPLPVRLFRSVKREHAFKFEFIRRAFADYVDFRDCHQLMNYMYAKPIFIGGTFSFDCFPNVLETSNLALFRQVAGKQSFGRFIA